MKEQVAVLYDLQGIDMQISEAQARLEAMDGAKAYRRRYSQAKATYEAAGRALQNVTGELKDSELKLKTMDEKRTAYEKRLYNGSISNPKELSAVEREIEVLKEQQSELDGVVLGLYDAVEAAKQRSDEARTALETSEAQARAAIKKEAAEKVSLESRVSELTAKRNEMAAGVTDKALMSRYNAVRKRTNGTAVAKVHEGKCEGCHVGVTAYIMRNLYSSDDVQTCENCGRILMLDVQ